MAEHVGESGASPQRIKALLALRDLILSGEYPPGQRLSEIPVGERLGMSRTPLRLALVALEHEGLLAAHPAGGYVVRGYSEAEVIDAIELRGVLEGTAARFAAERLDDQAALLPLHELVAEGDHLVHGGSRGSDATFQGYVELNERFHRELHRVAASAVLVRSLAHAASLPFASHNALVRRQGAGPQDWMVVAQEQHRAIVEAIARRQGARAEALAREHAQLARRNLEAALAADEPLATVVRGGSLIDVQAGSDDGRGAVTDRRQT